MEMTPENDPLAAYGYPEMMSVEHVMELFQVSDPTARKFLKNQDLYLLIAGAARCPRYGLAKVIFEEGKAPEDSDESILNFRSSERSSG